MPIRAAWSSASDGSLARKASARGNPVQVRDGPAAVRGDAPPSKCHWREPGRRRKREPRVRRPAARPHDPRLLAEGGKVFRRSLFVALVAAFVLVPSALAARVHVRVEGKTQTIFGATEPTLNVKANALDALESASLAGEFYYPVTASAFGPYVNQIGRYPPARTSGLMLKRNGVVQPVA